MELWDGLLNILHMKISRKRRGVNPRKAKKQEVDSISNGRETKEKEKK